MSAAVQHRYHVVCHTCKFENLYDDMVLADNERETHVRDTGHDVDMQGVRADV